MFPNLSLLNTTRCHPINTPLDEASKLALFRLNISKAQFDYTAGQLECSVCFEKLAEPAPRRETEKYPIPRGGVPQFLKVCSNNHYLHGKCQLFSYQVKKSQGFSDTYARKCAFGCGAEMTQEAMVALSIIPSPAVTQNLSALELKRQVEEMRRLYTERSAEERAQEKARVLEERRLAAIAALEAKRLEAEERRRVRQATQEQARSEATELKLAIQDLAAQGKSNRLVIRQVSDEDALVLSSSARMLAATIKKAFEENIPFENEWLEYWAKVRGDDEDVPRPISTAALAAASPSTAHTSRPSIFPPLTEALKNKLWLIMQHLEYLATIFSKSGAERKRFTMKDLASICAHIGGILLKLVYFLLSGPSSSRALYVYSDKTTRLAQWRSVQPKTFITVLSVQRSSLALVNFFRNKIYNFVNRDPIVFQVFGRYGTIGDPSGWDGVYSRVVKSISKTEQLMDEFTAQSTTEEEEEDTVQDV